jgi:transposase-like protein
MDDQRVSEVEREIPSVEVPEKPVRRRFSAEYKLRILAEADSCTESGQLGELLRREGLFSSHLSTWRRQRDEGALAGLTPKRRGRKAKPKNPLPVSRATPIVVSCGPPSPPSCGSRQKCPGRRLS